MQRLVHPQRLSSNRHGLLELFVAQRGERPQQRLPPRIPLRLELGARHGPRRELLLPLTPRLLAIAGEEIREARAEVAGDVPADDGNRVAAVRAGHRELGFLELIDGRLRERLVAEVFGPDRIDEWRHGTLERRRRDRGGRNHLQGLHHDTRYSRPGGPVP
jgi:hypothetical protein